MQKYTNNVLDSRGAPIVGASIGVQTYVGSFLATIYADPAGTIPLANPMLTDANGMYSFYAVNGRYTVIIDAAGYNTVTISDILLEDIITPTLNSASYNITVGDTGSYAQSYLDSVNFNFLGTFITSDIGINASNGGGINFYNNAEYAGNIGAGAGALSLQISSATGTRIRLSSSGSGTPDAIRFYSASSEKMQLNNLGRFLVGGSLTDNGTDTVQVNGSIGVDSTVIGGQVNVYSSGVRMGHFDAGTLSAFLYGPDSSGSHINLNGSGATPPNALRFYPGGTESVRMLQEGRTIIGQSPTDDGKTTLQILGSASATGSATVPALAIGGPAFSGWNNANFQVIDFAAGVAITANASNGGMNLYNNVYNDGSARYKTTNYAAVFNLAQSNGTALITVYPSGTVGAILPTAAAQIQVLQTGINHIINGVLVATTSAGTLGVVGTVSATNGVIVTPVAFASLPASPVTGQRAMINNSVAAPAFLSTAAGGGSTTVPVFYNGTTWLVG